MAISWLDHVRVVIDAADEGLTDNVDTFTDPRIGPMGSYTNLDYPVGEIVPENSEQTGANEYTHTCRLNFYFEYGRNEEYLPKLSDSMAVVDDVMDNLDADGLVISYRPTRIENFAGEPGNSLILMISVQFQATTLVNWPDS